MAYCGTAQVEYMAQVAYGDLGFASQTTFNTFIEGTLIPQVENKIDDFCGGRDGTYRRFNINYGSVTLDGSGKSSLFIPDKYTPWNMLGTLKQDGSSATLTNIKVHDQYLDWWQGAFSNGAKNILLIGSYGFTAVPATIQEVAQECAANALVEAKRRSNATGVTGVGIGAMSTSYSPPNPSTAESAVRLTREMRETLSRYRIRWMDLG